MDELCNIPSFYPLTQSLTSAEWKKKNTNAPSKNIFQSKNFK